MTQALYLKLPLKAQLFNKILRQVLTLLNRRSRQQILNKYFSLQTSGKLMPLKIWMSLFVTKKVSEVFTAESSPFKMKKLKINCSGFSPGKYFALRNFQSLENFKTSKGKETLVESRSVLVISFRWFSSSPDALSQVVAAKAACWTAQVVLRPEVPQRKLN